MKPTAPSLSSGPRVLVADATPLQAQAVESMLKSTGWREVRYTSDSREIVPLYQKWPFDVLILDMNMADLEATSVLAALRKPIGSGALAVIGVTESGDARGIERALTHGAIDICTRPLGRAETQARIKNALAVRRVPNAAATEPVFLAK